jgi:hypothetical protein
MLLSLIVILQTIQLVLLTSPFKQVQPPPVPVGDTLA